ncbi:MAG: hypothetical protein HZA90_13265 [Verrucomicrobia bacterium]|nr:hypothetical protein [Verrucomicrobiota bacterium]
MSLSTVPSEEIQSRRVVFVTLLAINTFFVVPDSPGAAPSRIPMPSLGGIDPRPVLLSVSNTPGRIQAFCAGYAGGPFQAEVCTNLTEGGWRKVGPVYTNNYFTLDLTNESRASFYRVSAPFPFYTGADACGQCHSLAEGGTFPRDVWYDYWLDTPHAKAFLNLTNHNPANATNAACLSCHTVAFGYPGGYTPGNSALQGVQCESCHGPGGVRHRSDLFPDRRPAVEWGAKLCGGCHVPASQPTYTDWTSSKHAQIQPDVAASFRDPTNGMANMLRCGPCHSGALRAYFAFPWATTMPSAETAGSEGIVCVACHDPHVNTSHGHQLRNPLFSTNSYSVQPATNWASFSQQYQAGVNLCAQCHNARGAAWTDTSEPPHRSPQYNMLLGSAGELDAGGTPFQPAAHALLITNQCVGCHMPKQPSEGPAHPALTGHTFKAASFDTCRACHPLPELLTQFATTAVSNRVQRVKSWLDVWATTKAPASLRAKYGAKAWEYTAAGTLSERGSGPDSAEQALIPVNIRKARFNLYLVHYDGSSGIHNGPYAITLLDAANNWIQAELNR